jgi:nucleoside-diphosphate-sugar epimerase
MRRSVALLAAMSGRGGVIVTGGGSGLGEAVARRLRQDGLNVIIADLKVSHFCFLCFFFLFFLFCDTVCGCSACV